MQTVRFLKNYTIYNPQEVAGFAPEIAADLVARGIAEVLAEGGPVEELAPLPSNPTPDTELGSVSSFKMGRRRR